MILTQILQPNCVKVPVENRLGAEGQGWMVTVSALANERSSISEVTAMYDKLDKLRELIKNTWKGTKPVSPAGNQPAILGGC